MKLTEFRVISPWKFTHTSSIVLLVSVESISMYIYCKFHSHVHILGIKPFMLCFLLYPADHTDCLVSEWGPWSECSKTCGFGRQERHRTIIQRASGRGQYCPVLREDKTCGTMKTCQWNSFQFLKRNG